MYSNYWECRARLILRAPDSSSIIELRSNSGTEKIQGRKFRPLPPPLPIGGDNWVGRDVIIMGVKTRICWQKRRTRWPSTFVRDGITTAEWSCHVSTFMGQFCDRFNNFTSDWISCCIVVCNLDTFYDCFWVLWSVSNSQDFFRKRVVRCSGELPLQ